MGQVDLPADLGVVYAMRGERCCVRRKVRTKSGAMAVQIAEREGGRDKVLAHLGSARTDG